MKIFKRMATVTFLVTFILQPIAAHALNDPDQNYMERFKPTAPFTVVVEYVNKTGTKIVEQRTFTHDKPFRAGPNLTIELTGMSLSLYGISPCYSDKQVIAVPYKGPCNLLGQDSLQDELAFSPLILCRVYAEYGDDPIQDAACWARWKPVMDVVNVHNIEAILLQVGAVVLAQDKKGKYLRPGLEEDQDLAKAKEAGLWNPRVQNVIGPQ